MIITDDRRACWLAVRVESAMRLSSRAVAASNADGGTGASVVPGESSRGDSSTVSGRKKDGRVTG